MTMLSLPHLGHGVGLRTQHYATVLDEHPARRLVRGHQRELHGRRRQSAPRPAPVRERYPVVLHGVSLSIGSVDPLDPGISTSWRRWPPRSSRPGVAITCAGRSVGGQLLARSSAAALHRGGAGARRRARPARAGQAQAADPDRERLQLRHLHAKYDDRVGVPGGAGRARRLRAPARRQQRLRQRLQPRLRCRGFIDGIPVGRVGQIHLAGHSDYGTHLLDTHDHAVCDGVWALYRQPVERFGRVPTLVEWDDHIPPFAEVLAESQQGGRDRARGPRCPRCVTPQQLFWKLITAPEGVGDGLRRLDMKSRRARSRHRRRRAARRGGAARHLRQHVLLPPAATSCAATTARWSPPSGDDAVPQPRHRLSARAARRRIRRCATSASGCRRFSRSTRSAASVRGWSSWRAWSARASSCFDGPDAEPLTLDDLRALAPEAFVALPLPLVPSRLLLEVEHAVDDVWRAVEDGEAEGEREEGAEREPPPPPAHAPRTLLVWRQEVTSIIARSSRWSGRRCCGP